MVGVAKRHAADEFESGISRILRTTSDTRQRLCAGFEAVSPGGQHYVLDEHAAVDP